ncbi:hypothetical protein L1987_83634 [Smallanthus sonchifolius]|uniref:Uncharacterized protein n=1 Tax=Smallanthus sonchifolius TaxID=185202 RepID=A0ACB8YDZ3_9ASTR|nr:hypothetical protein L1987_83634 [Smallanthus sonchifolius]
MEGRITRCYIKSLRIWNHCRHAIVRRPYQRHRSCRLRACPDTKCPIRQRNSLGDVECNRDALRSGIWCRATPYDGDLPATILDC